MSRTGVNVPALLLRDLGGIAGHGAPISLGTPTRTRFGLGSVRMGVLGPLTAHEVRSLGGVRPQPAPHTLAASVRFRT